MIMKTLTEETTETREYVSMRMEDGKSSADMISYLLAQLSEAKSKAFWAYTKREETYWNMRVEAIRIVIAEVERMP